MSDLIYRAALKKLVAEPSMYDINVPDVLALIDEVPTIDAAPVVRCKDCWKRGTEMHCPMCYDECFHDEDDGNDWVTHDQTEDEGFCHKGAKME